MIVGFLKKILKPFYDFSTKGFILRKPLVENLSVHESLSMWVDQTGWKAGIKRNIIRCYSDGFSFWHGDFKDEQEWFCSFDRIAGFESQFFGDVGAPVVLVKYNGVTIKCMLGDATYSIRKIYNGSCKEAPENPRIWPNP